ncbi:MAG TPA: NAD-dependent epimerase/dehydratase family protein [Polyangiaceae bacterium]|nr:NAD-dependent epimerase/dehydratase family protein [Polyangiaceae bacterium]
MKVLVTGAASPRGRLVIAHLHAQKHEVVGIDTESWPDPPSGVKLHVLDIRKRGFEDLMRRQRFDAVVHLAVHAGFRLPPAERHRLNLEGTGKVVELAAEHGVKQLVVASHASVYGALPDNPYFMTEDAPPQVGRSFPEMQDLVTADLLASSAMWKHPKLSIVVLRPVHSLGPTSRDVMAQLLRRKRFPTVLGFDPMIQVMHESDLARAFGVALQNGARGVYNVTGPGEVPLSVLIEEAGARAMPVPELVLALVIGRFGLPEAGSGALDFLKHPCLVDGSRFREATGFEPERSLRETVRSMRAH